VSATPFLLPGWLTAWWRAFGTGKLRVLTSRRGGRLCGVLPVAIHGGASSSPTNWHTPEFGLLATDAEAAHELYEQLFATHPRRVELSFLDPEGPTVQALSPPSGYSLSERPLLQSPYVATDGDAEAYFEGRSANLRKSLRRTRRRLEEMGELSFDVERDTAHLDDGLRIEAAGWKGERGSAILKEPEADRFYHEVAGWAADAGSLRVAFLRLDGRPIAFELALQDDRSFYVLKHAFDPELARFNPAKLLTAETIRRAFDQGLSSYEFLGADEPYKRMWTDSCRERIEVQLFSRTAAGRLDAVVQKRGRELVRRARSGLKTGRGEAAG
jgi:CelD/BcsL family acetyltransferase involved in cellulose biosynthesis